MTHIVTDIDYERNGKQVDWLYLPHSVTRSAYGNVLIPIGVVRNGTGATVLLTAGTHGDEYEGQVVLTRFIRELDPGRVQGRLIVIPALNTPAALAGTRVSPIDQGNLLQLYPGSEDGGITAQIADYVTRVLFPMADFHQDFHSGGGSLAYLPFVHTVAPADPVARHKAIAALKAVNAPRALLNESERNSRAISTATRLGVVALTGEWGGTGSVDIGGVRLVERSMRRLLAHAGVMETPPEHAAERPSRTMTVRAAEHNVYATENGLFEPFTTLGDEVEAGQPCGQILFVEQPMRAPVILRFRASGLVVCKRHIGRVAPGDCVAHLAADIAF